jgi:hypothetical protein
MCARCHHKLEEDDRCENDAHNWYPRDQRIVLYRDVLAGVQKVVDRTL